METRIRDAWGKLDTTFKRAIQYGDSTCMGVELKDFGADGIGLHCAFFVDKQGVGTIPMEDKVLVVLGEKTPDKGENFLVTGVFAFVSGDEVISANAGVNAAKLRTYLYKLFPKADLHEDSTKFDIVRRPDVDKLKMIEDRGVEKIDLQTSLSEATVDRIKELAAKDDWLSNAKATMLQAVRALVQKDDEATSLLEAQKGRVNLSIGVPSGDLQKARHGLKALADEIVDDEDGEGFVIHLHGGETIKSSEIAVRRKVRIEKHANSLDPEDAWGHMRNYMVELKENKNTEV